ncbi:MAG: DJ-1/PfpI family protein [Ardenticatenaceae bacterium]|nr:DJ-1/PfpI family protein [Ardenticatenaceae bacterium]
MSEIRVAFILLASGFDELFVVKCFLQLQQNGFQVHLVSARSNRIRGQKGIEIIADISIGQQFKESQNLLCDLAVIPGPQACVSQIFLNPIFYEFLKTIIKNGSKIMSPSSDVQELLNKSGLFESLTEERELYVQLDNFSSK